MRDVNAVIGNDEPVHVGIPYYMYVQIYGCGFEVGKYLRGILMLGVSQGLNRHFFSYHTNHGTNEAGVHQRRIRRHRRNHHPVSYTHLTMPTILRV